MAIFEDVFTKMDDAVINVLGTKTGELINLISPLILTCFTMYVLLIAISYIRNGVDPAEMGFDIVYRMLAWAVILGLSLNIGNYTSIVVKIVNDVPNEMVSALGMSGNTTNALDNLIDMYIDRWTEMYKDIPAFDIGGRIAVSIIWLLVAFTAIPYLIIAGGYIMLAKVMSAVLLVIGPMFIIMAMFPATRQYTSLWVSQCLNYMLLNIILNIVVLIQLNFITDVVNTSVSLTASNAMAIGMTSSLFIVVAIKIPELSSALSNGLVMAGYNQASRAGVGRAVSGAGGGAKTAGSMAGKFLGGGAMKLARLGGNRIKSR